MRYTKFQEHILEELNETGDYVFILLMPYFLELDKDHSITDYGEGVGAYSENYDINDNDFKELQQRITQLFQDFDLGIYKRKDNVTFPSSDTWEDRHELLSPEEIERILSKKENWIFNFNQPAYLIADKGADKVEEYIASMHRSS